MISKILDKIASNAYPGYPGQFPDVLRKFRTDIRACYDHGEEHRHLFNQAFETSSTTFESLAHAYHDVTMEQFPQTVPNIPDTKRDIILMADGLLSSREFCQKPKEERRKQFGEWLREKLASTHQTIRDKVREEVVRHYEEKFNTSLREVMEEFPPMEFSDKETINVVDSPVVNPPDVLKMDIPLFIRLMEFSREDARDDVALHRLAANLIRLSQSGKTLDITDYETATHEVNGTELEYLRTLAGIGK